MAKKKEVSEETKNNIENLDSLAKEFSGGKMLPRKAEMLKLRLAELWKAGTLSEDERDLLKAMLGRELRRGTIEDKYKEIINRIEAAECTDFARCKADDAPPVFRLKRDMLCPFRREDQANIKKAEAGSLYQYVIFIEEIIPPEHQMTKELLLKEERGHHASPESYPKEKTIMHRLQLDDAWFDKIFDIEEDLLSEKKDEEYIF